MQLIPTWILILVVALVQYQTLLWTPHVLIWASPSLIFGLACTRTLAQL